MEKITFDKTNAHLITRFETNCGKQESISNILVSHMWNREETVRNRTICYLLYSSTIFGEVRAETTEIFDFIFRQSEVLEMSESQMKEKFEEIKATKRWMYQQGILRKTKANERYICADISVYRIHTSGMKKDELCIMCNRANSDYEAHYLECVNCSDMGTQPTIEDNECGLMLFLNKEGYYPLRRLADSGHAFPEVTVDIMMRLGWIEETEGNLFARRLHTYSYESEGLSFVAFQPERTCA